MTSHEVVIRKLGLINYSHCLKLMQQHIESRLPMKAQEIWVVEHPSIYSQGQAGKQAHILDLQSIPLIRSDRGGQITYHGPGQLVCYFLFNLQQLKLNVRQLVDKTTSSVIHFLAELGISAQDDKTNPGVYVGAELDRSKIGSLGFRVRRHMSYHGVAINLHMDLSPFDGINPCGLQQKVSQVSFFAGEPCPAAYQKWVDMYLAQVINTFTFDSVIVTQAWPKAGQY